MIALVARVAVSVTLLAWTLVLVLKEPLVVAIVVTALAALAVLALFVAQRLRDRRGAHMLATRLRAEADAAVVVAYLRTLAPVKNDPGKTEIQFPVSMLIRALPQPLTGSPPPAPPLSDKLARGNWLLDVASCHDCHDSTNERMEIPGKAFGGGTRYPVGSKTIVAPNISSDKATGIGAYSDDDLRRVFDEGKGKSGRTLYMMPWSYYSGMTKEDKEAMIVALRAQPPVNNLVVAKGLE